MARQSGHQVILSNPQYPPGLDGVDLVAVPEQQHRLALGTDLLAHACTDRQGGHATEWGGWPCKMQPRAGARNCSNNEDSTSTVRVAPMAISRARPWLMHCNPPTWCLPHPPLGRSSGRSTGTKPGGGLLLVEVALAAVGRRMWNQVQRRSQRDARKMGCSLGRPQPPPLPPPAALPPSHSPLSWLTARSWIRAVRCRARRAGRKAAARTAAGAAEGRAAGWATSGAATAATVVCMVRRMDRMGNAWAGRRGDQCS